MTSLLEAPVGMTAATDEEGVSYPLPSMIAAMILIYASPFVSLSLNYVAFVICLYRAVRYRQAVFSIDYCALAGVSYIFLTTTRVSLLAWLSIAASAWYILRYGLVKSTALVLLVIVADYLLLRTGSAFNTLVLCVSPLLLLYVLIASQERRTIVPSSLAFCGNLILSSVYGLVFRDAPQIRSLLGEEASAYWGSSLTRFQGLFRDPNYYMTLVLISIALLVVLWLNHRLAVGPFCVGLSALVLFGALTYSKTFIIVLALAMVGLLVWLFWKGYYLIGLGGLVVIGIAAFVLGDTVFSVTVYRIVSSSNLDELTTGRNELLAEYVSIVTNDAGILFFGRGLSAELLYRGTHNLYLEVVYHTGLVGLSLLVAYCAALVRLLVSKLDLGGKGSGPGGMFRHSVLLVYLLMFCTLQGMTFTITYVMLYLAIVSAQMKPRQALESKEEMGGPA